MAGEKYKHLSLPEPKEMRYAGTGRGNTVIPSRDFRSHSEFLKKKFEKAWSEAVQDESAAIIEHRKGIYLEFKSFPDIDLLTKSLEEYSSEKACLCNVREVEEDGKIITYATVYIDKEYRLNFLRKIHRYATEKTPKGNPQNAPLMNSISDINKVILINSFWTDDTSLIPDGTPQWCEVWLRGISKDTEREFSSIVEKKAIPIKSDCLRFPERMVKLVYASKEQLEFLTLNSDDITEYRRAKETAAFWAEMPPRDQAEWVDDFLNRLEVSPSSNTAICILDMGVNNGHPMLLPILSDNDCHSVEPSWGTFDNSGHGTLMAGVCAYGNVQSHLSDSQKVRIEHILESSKILPPPPSVNPIESWGYKTIEGISRPEIQAPHRKRIFCMAITADGRERGRPTSWSSAVDQVTFGAEQKRLLVISAGNTPIDNEIVNYPDKQITESVQDPAQSWNALTVGSYTQLSDLTHPSLIGYTPIAGVNQLSPFSTTSLIWENKWPIKPDIVMEGGNVAVDGGNFPTKCEDLSFLSTYYRYTDRMFDQFQMTSLATGLASEFAAKIQTRYPDYWPETIRGLMVHSAEWRPEMKRQFKCDDTRKADIKKLMKVFGYGVPNIENALYTASNSLTLVAQSYIQPYFLERKEKKKTLKMKEMHLYELPWPKEVLRNLPFGTHVEMRVTLSFFIEPGPGELGWKDRYRYASHSLRFDINSPEEDARAFVRRINVSQKESDEDVPETSSAADHWVIGSKTRDKGSVISDIWKGTAAQLAESSHIAVFPRGGWWKERKKEEKYNNRTRYSLIVSIRTPDESIDVYTPVAAQLSIPITT
jgi:hypothetical protein